MLQDVCCLIVETCLFPVFEGGSDFRSLFDYLDRKGFALYDMLDLTCRPIDNAAFQFDAVFVPQTSPLRSVSSYATADQKIGAGSTADSTV
jgi:hypothetical protein